MTTPTSEPNKDLARKVIQVVTEHPEFHNQEEYICETIGCLAGWTVALSQGARPGDVIEDADQGALADMSPTDQARVAVTEEDDVPGAEWALESVLLNVAPSDLAGAFMEMDRERAIRKFKVVCGIDGDSA